MCFRNSKNGMSEVEPRSRSNSVDLRCGHETQVRHTASSVNPDSSQEQFSLQYQTRLPDRLECLQLEHNGSGQSYPEYTRLRLTSLPFVSPAVASRDEDEDNSEERNLPGSLLVSSLPPTALSQYVVHLNIRAPLRFAEVSLRGRSRSLVLPS